MSHFHFDGTSYITTPTTPDVQITGNVSIHARVRVPPYVGVWRTFLSTCGQSTGYLLRQGETGDALEMIHADGSWRQGEGSSPVPPDVWKDVTGVAVPGDKFAFTIDGQLAGTDVIDSDPGVPETTVPVCIGAYIGGATSEDQFMVGDITRVTVSSLIDNPPNLEFDAGDTNIPFASGAVPDGANWTDSHGREWTIHGSGITFSTSTGVDRHIGLRAGESNDVFPGNPEMRIVRGRK